MPLDGARSRHAGHGGSTGAEHLWRIREHQVAGLLESMFRENLRAMLFRRGLALVTVVLMAAACTRATVSRLPTTSRPPAHLISASGWRVRVDGVILVAAHADFDPHPQQVRVFKTSVKSALGAMPEPKTLVRLPPDELAYLAVVTGRLNSAGTYSHGHWVGAPVQLVLLVSKSGRLASYWSSGGYGKTQPKLAGLGASVELPTSLPHVPSIPDIFGVERFGFDGFPVVGRNDQTISVLTVQQCGGQSRLAARSYPGRVVLVVAAPNGAPDQACPADLVIEPVSATLPAVLGSRVLVDGITGKTVPYFDARSFAAIAALPSGYECGSEEPGAFDLNGSGAGATVYCSGQAKDSAPLAVEQKRGVGTVSSAAWPVVGHPSIAGHLATLRVAASSGEVYVRALSWSMGGYSFVVISSQEKEGQPILSSGELLDVARGLHLSAG